MATITTKNKQAIEKFYNMYDNTLLNEYSNYKNRFKSDWNTARIMYEYGKFDIFDYDLYCTLVKCGVTTKPVKEFEKVLDWGCTYKHRENIRNEYVKLIYNTIKVKVA